MRRRSSITWTSPARRTRSRPPMSTRRSLPASASARRAARQRNSAATLAMCSGLTTLILKNNAYLVEDADIARAHQRPVPPQIVAAEQAVIGGDIDVLLDDLILINIL